MFERGAELLAAPYRRKIAAALA
eukprot:SAG11_NODE_18008_length_502_cov_1.116625_1_plen_22_part_01